jgi:hypothetical protein
MNSGDEPTDPTPDLQDMILDLNFTPDWARSAPGVQSDARERPSRDRDDRRGPPRPRGGSDRRSNDRPPPRSGTREGGPARRVSPSGGPPGEDRSRQAPRDGDRQGGRDMRQERPPRPPRFPVRVDFLPVRENLHRIVHIIHRAPQAFPLDELAYKFLSNPDALLLKITPREGVEIPIFQCGAGGEVFVDRAEAEAHLVATHMPKVFVAETVRTTPPKGVFQSVGRCRRTGTLLGPPNHHSYADAVENCRRTHFADWPRDRFMQQVEMVKDAEVIEQWRELQSTITVYRERPQEQVRAEPAPAISEPASADLEQPGQEDVPSQETPVENTGETVPQTETPTEASSEALASPEPGGNESPALSQKDAEKIYRTKYIPALLSEKMKIICPASWLLRDAKTDFAAQVRDTHGRELNNPFSIMLALRPALKHMKCHLFKVAGRTFVSGVAPNPVDPSLCAAELKSILIWVLDHPGVKRRDLLEALHPGKNQETPEAVHLFTQLHWLAEKGHVIQFSDGTLVAPKAPTA